MYVDPHGAILASKGRAVEEKSNVGAWTIGCLVCECGGICEDSNRKESVSNDPTNGRENFRKFRNLRKFIKFEKFRKFRNSENSENSEN